MSRSDMFWRQNRKNRKWGPVLHAQYGTLAVSIYIYKNSKCTRVVLEHKGALRRARPRVSRTPKNRILLDMRDAL